MGESEEISKILSKEKGKPIEMLGHFRKATANVICTILFGQRYEGGDPELESLLTNVDKVMDTFIIHAPSLMAVPKWFRDLFMSKTKAKAKEPFHNLRELLVSKIKEHRRSIKQGEPPRDFYDVYILDPEREDLGMTDEALADTSMAFIPDSISTIANLMVFMLLYIMLNPEVQKIVQEEIDNVCGSNPPSLDDRSKMPFTTATIMESMRMSSVVTMIPNHKSLHGDTKFAGYNIPGDADIMGNIYAVHMDPDLFPNPEKFNPQRFIDSDGDVVKTDTIILFGMGK